MLWLAVGLAGVVLALVILALALWRYGVSEHEEEQAELRRIERLEHRLLEGQQQMYTVLLRLTTAVEALKPPPGPPVADHFDIVATTPRP
jgi:hypothetical protein